MESMVDKSREAQLGRNTDHFTNLPGVVSSLHPGALSARLGQRAHMVHNLTRCLGTSFISGYHMLSFKIMTPSHEML